MTTTASPAGVATGQPDLWCTYAAIRTLGWLRRPDGVPHPERTARYLATRRNADGGYAWSRGMASDAWATYYCTQGLIDLARLGVAEHAPAGLDRTAAWLRETWSGDAFAMMPGQLPDAWATFFSTRTTLEVCREPVPEPDRLLGWLGALQTAGGGLGWTPEHAAAGVADVRACFYGVLAWRVLARTGHTAPPWDVARLLAWLRAQQTPQGGFRFSPAAEVPCMWATYRATAALDALGGAPADPAACVAWIERRRGATGAFVRWDGYPVEDVWASFCAIGSLHAMGAPTAEHAPAVTARMRELACEQGGFTYREPALAADALATSATLLIADPDAPATAPGPDELRDWLAGCLLPNEGGVMYMPARGSEVRCTLWALSAGALRDDPGARKRVADWLGELQNPDGGFGYWEGRGSDVVSTVSAAEIQSLLRPDHPDVLDGTRLVGFLDACRTPVDAGEPDAEPAANVPGGAPTLRATLQVLRARQAVGRPRPAAVRAALDRHRVAGGGYANEGRRVPDLLSTYEAVLTADRHGVALDTDHLRRFVDRVVTEAGTAWTPLAPPEGDDLLATCVGTLLARRVRGELAELPALTLS
ncbi:prenyltransferase/squalene oxidase repeat-containing protein [Streptomyces millisiae]|uniref:Prenyltransferase/squalene oxidase repeat-containing protein n=1 Tax=Streptomyces millisiae TaxID=3075542 RepID=A0ABU2LID3_9ACTN|nr:prenyltransferase/squalene oxidase repeat-containing protein [Streptomyces sp. DSM 44918]MDT0317350.1 prenyltransferase/squalene oxidase repeat-containing protein [Streptomyces sp. DSM 44918]